MGDTELYEQIAAGDEQAVHTARHNSLGMSVMVWYMRWTLALDAKRREYQNVFLSIRKAAKDFSFAALFL